MERWAHSRGLYRLIGVDEVGRGNFAGPVVAAAVALPRDHGIEGLDDSKRLTERRRDELAVRVRERALAVAVAELPAAEIDRTDILKAAMRAMAYAVQAVIARIGAPQLVLVDGRTPIPLSVPQRTVIGGDQLSENIAAASIVAKVHRDALMTTLHTRWPVYAFDRNKGYGTAVHRDALRRHGPCPLHRRTFHGVVL